LIAVDCLKGGGGQSSRRPKGRITIGSKGSSGEEEWQDKIRKATEGGGKYKSERDQAKKKFGDDFNEPLMNEQTSQRAGVKKFTPRRT